MRVDRRVAPILFLTFLGYGARAHAQPVAGVVSPPGMDRSFDLQLFHPAVGSASFITLDGAAVLDHKLWNFGLVASYGYQLLSYTLQGVDGPPSPVTKSPVQNLAMAELVSAVGIRNRYEIGVALPVAVTWGGDEFDRYGRGTGPMAVAVAMGDLRIEAKAQLLGSSSEPGYLLSISAGGTLPTGDEYSFLGERNVTGRVRALLEYQRSDWLRALVMAGGLLRKKSEFFGTPMGPALLYGAALELRPNEEIGVIGEATGRVGSKYSDTNPAEVDAGMRFYLPSMVSLIMGGGFGLNHGLGSPTARAFVGLGWAPDYRDRDRDGLIDLRDLCPDDPEDWDGFEDGDGCSDPDNDVDGVPDSADKCPNVPEDKDRFQDEDGCPEKDNDDDGVEDLYDACPDQKEDGRGKRPTDGCPSTTEDEDKDGIHDAADKCPDEPEDKDGFQDEDGCPDYDNDADGVPDSYDLCPNEAEDRDGFEDNDGCPDPDNDYDGIPDTADKCPNQAETINYYRDTDGCPDPGPELVRLGGSDKKVYLAERIKLRAGRDGKPVLTMNSRMMVALVAGLLKAHTDVSRVRIEVYGEDQTKEATRERGEVVKSALVAAGVDAGRLEVAGLGTGRDRVDFVVASRHERQHKLPAIPVESAAPEAEDPSAAPTDPETQATPEAP